MDNLSDNWLTDGLIDFEYKKYMLLAYLKSVEQNFISNRLYPYMGDLVRHYQNLKEFMDRKQEVGNNFPRQLSQIDLENFIMAYDSLVKDDRLMAEIEKILDFSIPAIQKQVEEGREIYDWVEQQLRLLPVGIQPVQQQVGYLFIKNGEEKQTKVYSYKLTIFQSANERYRGINTEYITNYTASIGGTYESMKSKLIKREKLLVIPAVYLVESGYRLPLKETLLPLAQRILVRHLMNADQS